MTRNRLHDVACWVLGFHGVVSAGALVAAGFGVAPVPTVRSWRAATPVAVVHREAAAPPAERTRRFLHGDHEMLASRWRDTPEARAADAALEILQRGNAACRLDSLNKALELWSEVIEQHSGTPAWYMAILNSGEVLQEERREREAIVLLLRLLDDTAQEDLEKRWEAGNGPRPNNETPLEWHLGFLCSDWHDASFAVSRCYEALGDFERARHYTILARDRYPQRHICSLGAMAQRDCLDKRIEMIQQQQAEQSTDPWAEESPPADGR
jgi:tetratricopeptide (TPR) repeat protein